MRPWALCRSSACRQAGLAELAGWLGCSDAYTVRWAKGEGIAHPCCRPVAGTPVAIVRPCCLLRLRAEAGWQAGKQLGRQAGPQQQQELWARQSAGGCAKAGDMVVTQADMASCCLQAVDVPAELAHLQGLRQLCIEYAQLDAVPPAVQVRWLAGGLGRNSPGLAWPHRWASPAIACQVAAAQQPAEWSGVEVQVLACSPPAPLSCQCAATALQPAAAPISHPAGSRA